LEGNAELITSKRGRKAIPKDAKKWDDPTITMREIIENDLAGTPMESEIKEREERIKKMKDKKASKKATTEAKAIENTQVNTGFNLALTPLIDNYAAPKIVFRDGKVVIENAPMVLREENLIVVENKKPYKLNSMSFRTKNQTAKWTADETRKFYKAIEIFGADFSMIAKLFPTRNRDQIKNKFRKEEKANIQRMDEAFKKNSVLGKRSIMDRIRSFTNSLNAPTANGEINFENIGVTQLERTFSNTSTDSMDLRVIDEIKNIFINEIKPSGFVAPLTIGNSIRNEVESEEVDMEEDETDNTNKEDVKKNLLFRFLN